MKITDAYKDDTVKIQISLDQIDLAPIVDSLVQLGATLKPGVAPMGHLERILHTALERESF